MMTYAIANHNGCNFAPVGATEFPAFNGQEYCGQIYCQSAWAVPTGIHEQLGLPNHIDLYLTNAGHWAPTVEIAEHYLSQIEAPAEFRVKGASLNLFILGGSPNIYADYRVYQCSPGFWDAEEIERGC